MRAHLSCLLSLISGFSILLLSACPDEVSSVSPKDLASAARDETLVRLTERSGRIIDYSFRGTRCFSACDSASPSLQHFVLELRTPGHFRIELPDEKKTVTFDGATLVETQLDGPQQRIAVDPKGTNSTLPYQVSGQFLTEGWRAPLLAGKKLAPARLESDTRGGKIVVLQRPLQDSLLDRVEYWFRLPKADFVKTRFVGKDGSDIKRVEVTQEHSDPRTGYAFPKRWQVRDQRGQIASWVQLDKIVINGGISKTRFKQ